MIAGIVTAVAVVSGALALSPGRVIVGDSALTSVFCASRTDCFAVGQHEINDVTLNQVLHFNGKKWAPAATPEPGGTAIHDYSALFGVRCTSSAGCWAVGVYDKHGATLSQALHWNGKKWSQVATPEPGGTGKGDFNDLFDVVCTSAANCWADGDYGPAVPGNEESLNLVLHWNGRRWSHVDTPNPGGTQPGDISGLNAVRCTSAANCWGAGSFDMPPPASRQQENEVLHWNGKKWSDVTVPSPGKPDNGQVNNTLNALSCTAATSCLAVGDDSGAVGILNQTLRWNGEHWRTVGTPDPGSGTSFSNDLGGVSCTAPANCWAVGAASSGGPDENVALHWTGHSWFVVSVPDPAGTASGSFNNLNAVRCVSATDCWAVGDTQKFGEPEVNQILHWTGKKWFVAA